MITSGKSWKMALVALIGIVILAGLLFFFIYALGNRSGVITGKVVYDDQFDLSAAAELVVELRNNNEAGRTPGPISKVTISDIGSSPVDFELTYENSLIKDDGDYVVSANIYDADQRVLFFSDNIGVNLDDDSSQVEIDLIEVGSDENTGLLPIGALQRNARNTQRRADISSLRAQFDTFVSNNNGKLPTDGIDSGEFHDRVTAAIEFGSYAVYSGDGIAVTNVLNETTVGRNRIIYAETTGPTVGTTLYPSVDEIHVWGGYKCGEKTYGMLSGGNQNGGETNKYASTDILSDNQRAVAFVYQLEGETTARCDDNV